MTVIMLTPQKAAARAGVSRGTIMKAINDGDLTAFRDNRNRWQIDARDLSAWSAPRSDIITVSAASPDSPKEVAPNVSAIRLAVLEAELKGKDQRISDLERDRDSWKEQAQALARRGDRDEQVGTEVRRRWWPF